MTATMPTRTLKTLLISDGKPGHYHLSDGVCAALARRQALDITRLDVARPKWLPARALSALTNVGEYGRRAVPWALGFAAMPIPACDLIVSAGGDTLAANVALAKAYGCPNVFYGSLRRYRPEDFSLVLTSYADRAHLPRHAMTLKPSAFDPDTVAARARPLGALPVTGLLVGGDSGTVAFSGDDWKRVAALLTGGAQGGAKWIVSNSRRTPDAVSDALNAIAADANGTVEFIDVRTAGAGTLGALFAASDRIAVTVDSSSMISEAIWARKPVVALLPRQHGLPASEQGYRDYLASQGWIASLALEQASADAFEAACETVRPIAGNPLARLADLLVERLPALNGL